MAMMLSVAATRSPLIGCGVCHCSTLPPRGENMCADHRICYMCRTSIKNQSFIGFLRAEKFYVAHSRCFHRRHYYLMDDVISTCMVCKNTSEIVKYTANGRFFLCREHNRCSTCNLQFTSRELNTCQCIDGRPVYPRHCFDICQKVDCDRARGRNWYCNEHRKCERCGEAVTQEEFRKMKETHRLIPIKGIDQDNYDDEGHIYLRVEKYNVELDKNSWCHESCFIEPPKLSLAQFLCCICDNASDYCISYQGYLRYVCSLHSNCRKCTLCLQLSDHHVQSPLDKGLCNCDQPLLIPSISCVVKLLPHLVRTYNYTDAMKQFFLDAIYESTLHVVNDTCCIKRHVRDEECVALIERARTIQCAICREPMSKPIALSCGHLFCGVCLDRQQQVHRDTLHAKQTRVVLPLWAISRQPERVTRGTNLQPEYIETRVALLQLIRDRFSGRYPSQLEFTTARLAIQQHDEQYDRVIGGEPAYQLARALLDTGEAMAVQLEENQLGVAEAIQQSLDDEPVLELACATCRKPYSSQELRHIYIDWS